MISEWILILTLNGYNYGTGIEHIRLNSQEACEKAGTQWVNQKIDTRNRNSVNYICVKDFK